MAETKFILVVEDDPILKNLLGHTFAGKYQTLYASNGAEALALINQYTPAVILLDLMLPDMDGFTILQNIRARADAAKSVPVIIVSNLGQQADKDRALSIGANDYIVKAEVDIEEIVGRIEKMLGTTPETAPAPGVPSMAMPLVNPDPTLVQAPMSIPTATGPIGMAMTPTPTPVPAPEPVAPVMPVSVPMPAPMPEPVAPIAMAMPEPVAVVIPAAPAPAAAPQMPDALSGLMPSNPDASLAEGTQEKPFIV
ncbi:MAG: chemosensory pili system protein ChpA (sensor histidine kinase/response regulator) [Parcubacteria bacterium C7867-008]|nr:MAG: chemosensory pili system protein ChpA (sensor histidine kinase/response regulator) [Parcubacteria bacterium C7867-008]